MALGPLLPLMGVGILVVGTLLFWAAIQNWIAELIERISRQVGAELYTARSALVALDRAVVNGQRLFVATARTAFQATQGESVVTQEEVRIVRREDLPADVLERLERGEALEYEVSIGSMRIIERRDTTTYRLVVRRKK